MNKISSISNPSISEQILDSAYLGENRDFHYRHPTEFVLDLHGGEIISRNDILKENLWVFPDGSSLIHSETYVL